VVVMLFDCHVGTMGADTERSFLYDAELLFEPLLGIVNLEINSGLLILDSVVVNLVCLKGIENSK